MLEVVSFADITTVVACTNPISTAFILMISTSSFSNSTDPDDQPDHLLDERVLLLEDEEDKEEDVDNGDNYNELLLLYVNDYYQYDELGGIVDVLFAYLGDCNDDKDDDEVDQNQYDNESIYAILAFLHYSTIEIKGKIIKTNQLMEKSQKVNPYIYLLRKNWFMFRFFMLMKMLDALLGPNWLIINFIQLAVVGLTQKVLHELSDQLHAYHVNVYMFSVFILILFFMVLLLIILDLVLILIFH
ncbi:MAG: hypothetical protein EZS28_035927 [Streblomastix strix]|uniref:Uncharacterized protein n=1 Tax=Streblomastix strix TaxID=222440 RepID=A0A5J4UCM2_9EUKA|nr:MAG: hypothetical protein EZS28_035927 [Streblomastix strix]